MKLPHVPSVLVMALVCKGRPDCTVLLSLLVTLDPEIMTALDVPAALAVGVMEALLLVGAGA